MGQVDDVLVVDWDIRASKTDDLVLLVATTLVSHGSLTGFMVSATQLAKSIKRPS
jgi:hypothetical protein